ncbi:iron-containing alcohol dehydrogenase [Mechercharimyces sp. CAU 1602]|uniref:iron-containing alcohol dehydrogenase n=1 Tax=Mechercharimyces sp. CAU 1602 TaxID=2973933 RepID=UPI002163BF8C|nr:iron-containing alcohol dehydrogenase [Mechercharimyces sp. CAU 1602]MCS1350724.1 iron-containing alcohol dehydrogenase [Mechercharimyces sp. CAU 1602]
MGVDYHAFHVRTSLHNGAGVRAMIPDLFRGLRGKRIALFSDQGLKKAGVVERVEEVFSAQDTEAPEIVGTFFELTQDATSSSVNEATRFARDVRADALLAVGGGSVMDAVKGVKYSLAYELEDIKDVLTRGLHVERWPEARSLTIPHLSVPTTAGTGSEVSPISVIFNEEKRLKTNLVHPDLASDMAVLDPELSMGLPPFITAFTGFDALTHAIEALASPQLNSYSDALALQAIRLIECHLPRVVADGEDMESRMEMLAASAMAITAFSLTLAAIPVHNFAHACGALYRTPHGLANALFLPAVMKALPELYLPKIDALATALQVDTKNKEKEACLDAVIDKIEQMRTDIGLPSHLNTSEVRGEEVTAEDDMAQLVTAVQQDPLGRMFPLAEETICTIAEQVQGVKVEERA